MTTQRIPTVTTADELLRLPDDGFRYELVRGELRQMTPSSHGHGFLVGNVTGPLWEHVRRNKLGAVYGAETGFWIGRTPDTVRAPDAAFVRQARVPDDRFGRGFFDGAPDLAVEVVSPDDRPSEMKEKVAEWLHAGCAIVWVIDPKQRTVSVHTRGSAMRVLREPETLDGGELLPGFVLPVAEIFS